MTPDEIAVQVDALIDAGDERALKDFLVAHYTELPTEVQNKFLLATFEDALEKRVGDLRVTELREDAVAVMDALNAPEEPTK